MRAVLVVEKHREKNIYIFFKKNSNSGDWLVTEFVFGCQTYETGLFRTQKADGIMGMSMHSQTLVPTMRANGKIAHNFFSLCFMFGGGTMALGGIDKRLHLSEMQFTPLAKNSGWFTVRLLDILMNGESIDVPAAVYATGKGTIVDSGTTDTYLPRRASDKFKAAWAAALGPGAPKYANAKLNYSPEHVKKFPLLTFVFDNDVKVDVKPSAYVEQAGTFLFSNFFTPLHYRWEIYPSSVPDGGVGDGLGSEFYAGPRHLLRRRKSSDWHRER